MGIENYKLSDGQERSNLFMYVFIFGLICFVLLLIGREAFNWYVKHNAMLSEMGQMRVQTEKTNVYLKSI